MYHSIITCHTSQDCTISLWLWKSIDAAEKLPCRLLMHRSFGENKISWFLCLIGNKQILFLNRKNRWTCVRRGWSSCSARIPSIVLDHSACKLVKAWETLLVSVVAMTSASVVSSFDSMLWLTFYMQEAIRNDCHEMRLETSDAALKLFMADRSSADEKLLFAESLSSPLPVIKVRNQHISRKEVLYQRSMLQQRQYKLTVVLRAQWLNYF